MTGKAIIELRDVSKTYRMGDVEVRALDRVSLSVMPGEFVAIMGPSGSGKSTLLHVLGCLDRPDGGEYSICSRKVGSLSDNELASLRNLSFGFVFQQFHLLRRMNALENVHLPLIYSSSAPASHERAMEKLAGVALEDRALHRPGELSGGQQQRVAIARALINDPMIIFADEPTGNLDSKSEQDIMRILQQLNAEGKTIIMVTHEPEIASYASRIIKMRDGVIVSDEQNHIPGRENANGKIPCEVFTAKRSSLNRDELFGYFKQAIQTIVSNRVRSFLSMLGILVGVAAVIAMLAIGSGAKMSIEENLKSLGSNLLVVRGGSSRHRGISVGSGAVTRFTFQDVDAIRELGEMVNRVSGTVSGSAQVVYQNENWNTSVEGVSLDFADMRAARPDVGRWFDDDDIKKRRKVAIIGRTVVAKLFGDVSPIGKTIKINRINYDIIGIAPEKGSMGPRDQDDVIYLPLTTAMYRLLGKNYLDAMYVEVADGHSTRYVQGLIEEIIRKRHRLYNTEDTFDIRDMSEIQQMLTTTMNTMSMLLGSIAAISLIVGGIGIMNIMLVSVTERTREIGLRLAIGARRIDIMAQFLIESVVMTLSGGCLGVAIGWLAAFTLSYFAGWTTHVTIFAIFLGTAFSGAVGLFFGMWPAKRASQLDPVEALRYE